MKQFESLQQILNKISENLEAMGKSAKIAQQASADYYDNKLDGHLDAAFNQIEDLVNIDLRKRLKLNSKEKKLACLATVIIFSGYLLRFPKSKVSRGVVKMIGPLLSLDLLKGVLFSKEDKKAAAVEKSKT